MQKHGFRNIGEEKGIINSFHMSKKWFFYWFTTLSGV